jgi:shikimate kinase
MDADRNIVLIGFMGCGKSLTSKRLAKFLNRKVVSTDDLVEKREKRSITKIFKESGEGYFRKVEKEIVREISELKGVIVDCGGGAYLDSDNAAYLKRNGIVFYLSASPKCIYDNIKNRKHRPLLNVEDPLAKIKELLEARKPYYEHADVIINADYKTIDQIAESVVKVLENE